MSTKISAGRLSAEDPKLPIRPAMRPPSQGHSPSIAGKSLVLRIVTLLCGVVQLSGSSGELRLTTMAPPNRIHDGLG